MSQNRGIRIQEDEADESLSGQFECVVCFTTLRQDQSIFLQCEHVLCYDCSKTIVAKLVAQRQEELVYKCECCSTKTTLEQELVDSLMKAAKLEMRAEEVSASRNGRQQTSLRKEAKTANRRQVTLESKESLSMHSNDPGADSLFCLDCQAGCFSIDAYLAGHHKNHDVKSIPKAYPILVQNTQQLRMDIKRTADTLLELESKYNSRKRQLLDATSSTKKMLKSTLDSIRQTLQAKQREFSKQIESFLVTNFNEYERRMEEIRVRLGQLQQYEDELHERVLMVGNSLSKQTQAFSFFHSHKQQIKDALSAAVRDSQVIGKPQRVQNFQFRIDNDLIMKGCEIVRRLSLQIIEQGKRELNRQATTSRTRLLSAGTFEATEPSAIGDSDEYQQYFRKSKEQLYRKSNQAESAMRRIVRPKQNIDPNTVRERSRSRTATIQPLTELKSKPGVVIPSKISDSLERYKYLEHLKQSRPKILEREEVELSASRVAKERVNRIETLFYQSLGRSQEEADRELRSNTQC